ncbi:sulfotransferase family 2 domain-containing protein [Vibrio breoganii]
MIDHERKLLFIHIPKNAGNSVRELVFGKDIATSHRTASRYPLKVWEEYFTFAVCRNPYDKLWSHYQYHCSSGTYHGSLLRQFPRMHEFSFKNYFDKIVMSGHNSFNAQYEFTTHHESDKSIDLILRFETLATDVKKINKKFKASGEIKKLNQSTIRKSNWIQNLDWEDVKLINNAYQVDFDRFGYFMHNKFTFHITKLFWRLFL